jgi:hypothetical protein
MNNDIDAAEMLQHGVSNSRAALGGGDIGGHEQVAWCRPIGTRWCGDQDRRPRFAQLCHDGCADPLGAARDEGALSGKFAIVTHQRTSSAPMRPSAEKPKR